MELEKIESPAVKEVAGKAYELQRAAEQCKVVDGKSDYAAKELLSEVGKARKRLEELRKQFVAPLNDHVKKINTFFKQAGLPLEKADELLRAEVMHYFREQKERAEKEQERQERLAAKRQETADRQAKEAGEEAAPPVIVPAAPPPQKTVRTETGAVTIREIWTFKILNKAKVPIDFLMVDEEKVQDMIRVGERNIPGIRIYKTEVPVVRRG